MPEVTRGGRTPNSPAVGGCSAVNRFHVRRRRNDRAARPLSSRSDGPEWKMCLRACTSRPSSGSGDNNTHARTPSWTPPSTSEALTALMEIKFVQLVHGRLPAALSLTDGTGDVARARLADVIAWRTVAAYTTPWRSEIGRAHV